jgi:hypothetical protein
MDAFSVGSALGRRPLGLLARSLGSPRLCPLRSQIPPPSRNAVHGRHRRRVRHPRGVQRRVTDSHSHRDKGPRSVPAAAYPSGYPSRGFAPPVRPDGARAASRPAGPRPTSGAGRHARRSPQVGGPEREWAAVWCDPWRPHPPLRTWPRPRARVFSPVGPPNHRGAETGQLCVATCRHGATTCPSGGQIPLPHRTKPAGCRARTGGAHHAVADRALLVASRAVSPSLIANGEAKRLKMPNLSLLFGWNHIAKPLLKRDNLGRRTHARAHPINTRGEDKGSSRPRTDNNPRAAASIDLSYVLVWYLQIGPSNKTKR